MDIHLKILYMSFNITLFHYFHTIYEYIKYVYIFYIYFFFFLYLNFNIIIIIIFNIFLIHNTIKLLF